MNALDRASALTLAREEIRVCFVRTRSPHDLRDFIMAGDTVPNDVMGEAFRLEGYRVEGQDVWARRNMKTPKPWTHRDKHPDPTTRDREISEIMLRGGYTVSEVIAQIDGVLTTMRDFPGFAAERAPLLEAERERLKALNQ